jgi:pimeloyl-ACP methyl ester carboxylesterase
MLTILAAVLTGILVLLFTALAWRSPGRPRPFLGPDGKPLAGSIAEKIHVTINGVEQGMFITGRDRTRPVLLFVHGGPSMPEYWLSQRYPTVLEDLFVVCWWEQRGAGLSNRSTTPPETVTMEQLVRDTIEVTQYLRQRFGQDRIYLIAHSWGTVLGIQAADRAPELYHAYIAMAQVTSQNASERLAHAHMLAFFRQTGDQTMVKALERYPVPDRGPLSPAYLALRDAAMHRSGVGTTHAMRSVVTGVFIPSLLSPVYTLSEKLALWRGKWSPYSQMMWNQMLDMDLRASVSTLRIPVYFLHGAFDYTVAYPMAKDYFATLEAPTKGFYTFPDSAHSPLFEEPERTRCILRDDVLAHAHALADQL